MSYIVLYAKEKPGVHAGRAVRGRGWAGNRVFPARRPGGLRPKPRVNLTRFRGVFAQNRKHRAQMTPGKPGKKPARV